jgi:HAD superfamily hydrolase (TIGR01509 family)
LKRILCSQDWFEYERGRITQEVCYHRVGETFSVDPKEFENALAQAKDSLQLNDDLISVIRELKAKSNGKLRVFAMSNTSLPDFEALRAKPCDWSIFDEVFTSGGVGERKPHFRFYTHVIEKTGADPKGTIFIDDKFENVLQARCVGWHGIVFDSPANVIRQLRNLLDDQVKRGHEFLNRNAKKMHSIADTGVVIKENFAQLLILDATGNR